MRKCVFLFLFFLVIISCKEEAAKEVEVEEVPGSFSIQDYSKLQELAPDATEIVSSWPEFMAMEISMDVLKRASNTEDLKLAIEDLIEKEKALAESSYPKTFDILQIRSRQQLLRTFLYKVKGNLMDSREINESMEELITAYNAFKKQLNSISEKSLDVQLILNED